MRRLPVFVLTLATFAVGGQAFAWNKAGHMTQAAITYSVLKKESPATLTKVITMLKKHPQYEEMWAKRIKEQDEKRGMTQEEKDLFLFMQAARWADDVRSDSHYHQSEWHYINLPIKPAGQPDSVQPRAPSSNNIVRAFELNKAKAKSTVESPEDRAVALTWVFHLVGDVHQPLHTTNYYTTEYPKGDKGGNLFFIRVKAEAASVIPLHQFWDDLIIGSDNFQSVRNKATELRERADLHKDKLNELNDTDFEHWAKKESWTLAKDVVYRQGKLPGSPERDKAPTLPADYIPEAKKVAERRIVLAGYRLAAVLKLVAE